MAIWPWSNSATTPAVSLQGPNGQTTATDTTTRSETPMGESGSTWVASATARLQSEDARALDELRAAAGFGSTTQVQPSSAVDPDDSLYPSTLKCSQCFDVAFACGSFAGQFNNIYRYGGLRSCSDLWAQWRFCMRSKAMSAEERKQRVWEWNRDKEVRRRMGRNSEDIWELRKGGWDELAKGEGRGFVGLPPRDQ